MASKQSFSKTLYRSETNRILGGVAGGLGDYFRVDPTIIRIVFVLLTVFGGSGILIYLILWILIPSETSTGFPSEETIRRNAEEVGNKAKFFAHDIKGVSHEDSSYWFGWLIVLLGALLLFNNFGFLRFSLFWPIILIALGFFILLRER